MTARPAAPIRAAAAVAAAGLTAVLALASCEDEVAEQLIGVSASELLAAAADEMAVVQTVRVQVEADAEVADLPVHAVDGQVTRAGDAAGTVQVEQFDQLMELEFVVVGDEFHYRLVGGWQQLPRAEAADLYDPSAILDPDRGVAHLLRTASDAELDGTEAVAGVDTYRVTARFDPDAAAALLPGATGELTGTLWIGADPALLHRAEFTSPELGAATVRLSDFNAPADISAP